MASKCVEHNQCADCLEVFGLKQNLTRHVRNKVCYRSVFSIPIRDHISISKEIISAIEPTRLKFHASQRLGAFVPKLYPLIFSKQLPDNLKHLGHLLPTWEESINILTSILHDEPSNYLILPTKKVTVIIQNVTYDISSLTLPNAEDLPKLPAKFETFLYHNEHNKRIF